MQWFRRSSFAAALLAVSSVPALAQEPQAPLPASTGPWGDGLYLELDFSLGDSENPNTNADFGVDLDWSTSFGLGVGYRTGLLRFEGEFNTHFYRVGSLDLGVESPFAAADYAGGVNATNLMANLYVDFPKAGNMRPFLGAGYGIAWVEAEYSESVCFIYCFSTNNTVVDDSDRTVAWQAMAGLSFARSADLEWYLGYRYYQTGDLDFRTESGVPFRQEGIRDHAFMAGFRFLAN